MDIDDDDTRLSRLAKRINSVHVRLGDEADALLELIAQARGATKGQVLSDIAERALLGEGHQLTVAARRFLRSGIDAGQRENLG